MTVLSLFDGISCARLALKKAGISVKKYYASEIETNAIHVTQKNFPDTIQLSDVVHVRGRNLPGIDLLCGGSPCQGFSVAGKLYNFKDPRSRLFWEYKRLLDETKPTYFLFENVVMKKEWADIISEALGVEPILINSALTSAATRKRLYWTNIRNVGQPNDHEVFFGDIREHNHSYDNMYYSDTALQWFHRHEKLGKKMRIIGNHDKMQMLEASMGKKQSLQRFFGIEDSYGLRYITPLECERCMNVPDGYTSSISNTARYKALGNGWEVNAVAHIFGYIR